MRVMHNNSREAVYNAPIIPWNNGTYTPISNKSIMDLMDEKLHELDLKIKGEEYRTATTASGLVRGVIGTYTIASQNEEFGHKLVFRNSYDKSMSFAFAEGLQVFCCSNGVISGDFEYKRVHMGTFNEDTTSTWTDICENIDLGFKNIQESFDKTVTQMEHLKYFELGPKDVYDIIGELFFDKEIINMTQLSIVKRELYKSVNFKHLGDSDFSAYDCYNAVTEALKISHPLNYISDHTTLHKLFETTFGV